MLIQIKVGKESHIIFVLLAHKFFCKRRINQLDLSGFVFGHID